MVRRKRTKDPLLSGFPAEVVVFHPQLWPGDSEYQRWAAWHEARIAWAEANLPEGAEDLPDWEGIVPDQPWDEVKHLI